MNIKTHNSSDDQALLNRKIELLKSLLNLTVKQGKCIEELDMLGLEKVILDKTELIREINFIDKLINDSDTSTMPHEENHDEIEIVRILEQIRETDECNRYLLGQKKQTIEEDMKNQPLKVNESKGGYFIDHKG